MARIIKITDIDDYVLGQVEKLLSAVVLETDRRLKEQSPVDTGRFRSNWQKAKYNTFSHAVFNNLPYAERLSQGWSKQAPAGWVQLIAKDMQTYAEVQASRIGRES